MSGTTTRPGAPGSMDRQTRRALTAASYRRKRGWQGSPIPAGRRPGLLLTAHGRAVVLAVPRLPYGSSTHASAALVHMTDELLLAYRGGQVAGALSIWKCLNSTVHFQLTATELAAAARAAAPDLADTDIAARLLRLTAATAEEDTAGAWLLALTAAHIAGPALDEEHAHA